MKHSINANKVRGLLLLLLVSILFSCSTFRETHYFKDTLKPTANYYKVDVKGYASLSSSRYVSGYYDRGAVKAYFGELGQPAKGKFVPLTDETQKTGQKELVLLLSTNSDAIATSIGNLTKSKTVINSLSLIANKDKLERVSVVASEILTLNTSINLLIAKTDTYLDMDTASKSFDGNQAKNRLKQLVKVELMDLSNDAGPNSFTELYQWYLKNYKN